ncbi:MAG: ATP-binding protein [Bacteroidota bacterium]
MPDLLLPATLASVSLAGEHAEATARDAGWSSDDVDRLVLATTEAVGNAVEHGPGQPIRLRIFGGPAELTVEVEDGGEGPRPDRLDAPSLPRDDATEGRGLFILRALADTARIHGGTLTLTFRPRGEA